MSFSHKHYLSLESEWQQVSSDLQDYSQYSVHSQQSCSLDGLDSSTDFQLLQSLYQSFGDWSKCTNYNWYNHPLHVPQLFSSWARSKYLSLFYFSSQAKSKYLSLFYFSSRARSKYLSLVLLSFIFTLWFAGTAKSTWQNFFCLFFFLLICTKSCFLARIRWSVNTCNFQRDVIYLILWDGFWFVHIAFISLANYYHC